MIVKIEHTKTGRLSLHHALGPIKRTVRGTIELVEESVANCLVEAKRATIKSRRNVSEDDVEE